MSCEKCERLVYAKGLCRKHYVARWRTQKGDAFLKQRRAYGRAYKKRVRAKMTVAELKKSKAEHAAYERAWRARHRETIRDSDKYGQRYLRAYGLTRKTFQEMLAKQKGVCAVCAGPQQGNKRLVVDHCHKTKRVRGLLCDRCNHALGHFRDDPRLCRAGALYLEVSL